MAEDSKKESLNIFIANTIYPEAEAIFRSHYKTLEEIKNDCYVVLDTNALLVPYTTGKDSLEQIKNTYTALVKAGRLVIPGQVAREFAKNRANKISEIYDQLSKKRDVRALETGRYPLLESLGDYQQSLSLESEVNKLIVQYRDAIGKILEHIRNWTWNDPVSLLYNELFANGVIKDVSIDEKDTKEDLSRRQIHKIPPGYKDASKDDEGVGDLLIWRTILDVGKTNQKSVIFVSGEEKPDWWYRSNNQPLYPRYELIDEFRRSSKEHSFHIVKFSRFLDLYGASDTVVEEVREKEVFISYNQGKGRRFLDAFKRATAISDWLANLFPESEIEPNIESPDIEIFHPDGTKTAVNELYLSQNVHSIENARNSISNIHSLMAKDYDNGIVIIVARNERLADMLAKKLIGVEVPSTEIMIAVGYLSPDYQFVTVYTRNDFSER